MSWFRGGGAWEIGQENGCNLCIGLMLSRAFGSALGCAGWVTVQRSARWKLDCWLCLFWLAIATSWFDVWCFLLLTTEPRLWRCCYQLVWRYSSALQHELEHRNELESVHKMQKKLT